MVDTLRILERCERRSRVAFRPETGTRSEAAQRDASLYLAHVEHGASLRRLASVAGTHPSTVSRAVARVEDRRDDPLYDRLIAEAEAGGADAGAAAGPDEAEVRRAAKTALRRLSEPGAFLLLARGAAKGGIFCAANGHRKPIALLDVAMAAEFLRRDWIRATGRGQASVRYRIEEPGRAALKRILAEELAAREAQGFAEAQAPFLAQHRLDGTRTVADGATGEPADIRVNLAESPLGWLSRRKGADGRPFLAPEEVEAGERLRDDFEAAQMGPAVAQDWGRFLAPVDCGSGGRAGSGPAEGPRAARERVAAALGALGPGLSDVALRVCCFLEGLETCEKRMGWSARSGKVVLKLALQRLVAHYGLAR